MDAEILIKFKALNICSSQDLKYLEKKFEDIVKLLIQEEGPCGLFGLVEDDYEIISVKRIDIAESLGNEEEK